MSQQNIPLFLQNAGVLNPFVSSAENLTQLNNLNGNSTKSGEMERVNLPVQQMRELFIQSPQKRKLPKRDVHY
jgi:hypothetical protein